MFNLQSQSHTLRSITLSGIAIGTSLCWTSGALANELNVSLNQPEMDNEILEGMNLMIVLKDDTTVRCGDQDMFYPIGKLEANTRVQAAGVSEGYTMIVLPREIGALVPVDEVDAAIDHKSVTLVFDSKLRAPSHLLGMSGAWKGMYETALSSGTKLEVLEIMRADNESKEILGYRVLAPQGPNGEMPIAYIRTDALRPATDAEIRAFTNSGGDTSPTPTINPEPKEIETPTFDTQDDSNDQSNESQPNETNSADSDDQPIDDSLLEPMNTDDSETQEPVQIENSAPTTQPEPEVTDTIQRTNDQGRLSNAALENLEASFANARSLDRKELDEALTELHAEFSRARDHAENESSLARALDQRIEWINIRIKSRDNRRAIEEALATYDRNKDTIAQQISDWQENRAYQLVGRMIPSSVYNGQELALLYRVQIRDPKSGFERTVGYVAPQSGQDFRHMLGRVVGVIGSTHVDDSLGLKVIEPERIDLMPE